MVRIILSISSLSDGNGKKWTSLKAGVWRPQKVPDGVQGQCHWWGSGGKAPEAGYNFKEKINPIFWYITLLKAGSSQHCTQGCWFHKTAHQADKGKLQVYTEFTVLKQTQTRKRMHRQLSCLLLNTFLTVDLLKGRASCQELSYDRSAVFVKFYLSDSLLSTSTALVQYLHLVLSTAAHGAIYWLNIFWRSRKTTCTVPRLSIILIHFSRPITNICLLKSRNGDGDLINGHCWSNAQSLLKSLARSSYASFRSLVWIPFGPADFDILILASSLSATYFILYSVISI